MGIRSHARRARLVFAVFTTSILAPAFGAIPVAFAEHNSDLSITKVASNASPTFGNNVTYTITVTAAEGSGTAHIDNVTMTDVLPAGLTYVSHTDDETFTTCTYTSGTKTLSCEVASDNDTKLHKGESVVITLVATVSGCGSVSNTATVSEADPDITESNTANNTDTEAVNVGGCGTITIVKNALPDDEQDFAFSGTLGSFSLDDDEDGTLSNSQSFTKAVGTYTSTEASVGGWALTAISCNDLGSTTDLGSQTATIDLDSGESITCTFTNEQDTTATVTIIKQTVPDGDEGVFDFNGGGFAEGSALENAFSLSDGQSETDTEVAPGEGYSVTETVPAGWQLTDISCDSEGAAVNLAGSSVDFVLEGGDDVTCTFTNTKNGVLRINKNTYGGDGTFGFTADPEGAGENSSIEVTTSEGEGSTDTSLPPDDYDVSELAQDGWQLQSISCGTGGSQADVNAGETTTCNVVNIKESRVDIIKQTENGFGSFHIDATVDGEGMGEGGEGFDVTTSEGTNPASTFFESFVDSEGSTVVLNESQDPSDGWTMTDLACTIDGSGVGSSSGPEIEFQLEPGETAQCTYTNSKNVIGNGVVEETEECDDGNLVDNDGCSSTGEVEPGWACTGAPSACTTNCGDGVEAGSEQCDDDNNTDGDGCSAICRDEFCGDSVRNNDPDGEGPLGEACDDGDTDNGDGCSSTCTEESGFICSENGEGLSACAPFCGDGLIRGEEECDDGESDGGDGCSAICSVESGFACEGEPSACEEVPASSSSSSVSSSSSSQGEGEGSSESSSSSSSSESSSSSGDSSSEDLTITGLSLPDGPPGDNGAHRGSRTDIAGGIARFLAGFHLGSIPPGGFGGGDAPLSLSEKRYLCSLQRGLPNGATNAYIGQLAEIISEILGRSPQFVAEALRDNDLCASFTAARLPQKSIVVAAPKPFYVAADGIPYSRTDENFNGCIRGTVKPLLRIDCAGYHTGSVWHTDSVYFTYVPATKTKKMVLILPKEYVIVRDDTVVMK